MKRVLGLDLGTNTGWCVMMYDPESGSCHIDASNCYQLTEMLKLHGPVGRWIGFLQLLSEYGGDCDAIVYERVPPSVHTGGRAAQVYGALQCTLELWAKEHDGNIIPVSIQAAKKALTGTGNASKRLMMAAAKKRFNTPIVSSDHADAIGVALAGIKVLAEA